MKRFKLTKIFPVLAGLGIVLVSNIFTGCNAREGLLTNHPSPTINAISPLDSSTNIPLNAKIVISFSEIMDPTTIDSTAFTLKRGTVNVPGVIHTDGNKATFIPSSDLNPNTQYVAMIQSGVQSQFGEPMESSYEWTFTTGLLPNLTRPEVTLTDPVNGSINIPRNQKIGVTFSSVMDATTITASTFLVKAGNNSIAGTISFSGNSALFSPQVALLSNTLYTCTITAMVADLAGSTMEQEFSWSFRTGATVILTPPEVIRTDPSDSAVGIPINQNLSAEFSKSIDGSTVTATSFYLMKGLVKIPGTVSSIGSVLLLSPNSDLLPQTKYSATLTTDIKDLAGNKLPHIYTWTFTTGSTANVIPPTIDSTTPVDSAENVALNQAVSASFSKTMDASTITKTNFTLKTGNVAISGVVSYQGTKATFTPLVALASNTTYIATISTGVTDLSGVHLAEAYQWQFTTLPAVITVPPTVKSAIPVADTTGVPLDQVLSVVFSKTMLESSISSTTFTLKNGVTPVLGQIVVQGDTALFTPAVDLLPNTLYTATISTGVTDLSGVHLAEAYQWQFTTLPPVPPTVKSTIPIADTTGVPINQVLSVVFSKTMLASSISSTTFTLKNGVTPVVGQVLVQGDTAFFTPTVDLLPNTLYTATISSDVTDLLGVHLESDYLWSFTTDPSIALILDNAAPFGGFGGSAGLTNQGLFTVINGDVGTTAACTLVTGFHDNGGDVFTETPLNSGYVDGVINCAPPAPGTATKLAVAQNGLAAATIAYNYFAGLPGGSDPGAGELGGLVLAPGTYTSAGGTFKITNADLTLDAQGDPNAQWVFQIASALTVGQAGQPRSVILLNGAQAKNIVWAVGSAATINGAGGGTMAGTIIAYSGVTFSTAGNVAITTLNGRAISLNASATLVNTVINVP